MEREGFSPRLGCGLSRRCVCSSLEGEWSSLACWVVRARIDPKAMGLGWVSAAVKPSGAPLELAWKLAVGVHWTPGGKLHWCSAPQLNSAGTTEAKHTRNRKRSVLLWYPVSLQCPLLTNVNIMPAGKAEPFKYQKKIMKGRVGAVRQ